MAKSHCSTNICGFTANSKFAKLGRNRTVNCYVETTKVADKGVNRVVYGLGGFKSWKTMSGDFRGCHLVNNAYNGKPYMFAVYGHNIYTIDSNGVVTDKGAYSVGIGNVCFAEVPIYNGGDSYLVLVDGTTCSAINITNDDGVIHNITLPQRESGDSIQPSSVVHVNGHIVVNDAKTDAFYTSCFHPFAPNNGSVDYDIFMCAEAPTDEDGGSRPWYQYGYRTYAEYKGDKSLAILSTGKNIIVIGEDSIQVYRYNNVAVVKDVLTSASVWTCNTCYNIGCADVNSIQQIEDNIFFVGGDKGRRVFVMNNGGSPMAVSDKDLERDMAGVVSFKSMSTMVNGHEFYAITFSDKTYAYDLGENGWVNFCSNITHKFRYTGSCLFAGKVLFFTKNLIAQYTEDDFTDCGTPILRLRCGLIDANDLVCVNELRPIMDNGDGTMNLRLNWSNDGKTFNEFTIECGGNIGQYDFQPRFYDLGEGRTFNVELSTTSNSPFMLKDLEVLYEQIYQ